MATAVEPLTARALMGEQRILLQSVGREGYEALLAMVGDGHVRLTYDSGDVELMSPSYDHEDFKKLIARLIETMTVELDVPCDGAGSTTWRKPLKEKGLELDECYYLANAGRVRGRGRAIDLNTDPPPDLAVEIEISRSALDRMGIYAAIGVPEVWRYDGRSLRVEILQADGTYAAVAASLALPFLTSADVVHWIELGRSMGQTPWLRQFRDWVRAELAPRFETERLGD